MAAVVLATGDAAHAERLLDEATSVLRHAAPWFLSWTLYLRAFLAVQRGNAHEAIALVRESLTYIRQLHDKFAFVYAMVPLAAAAALKGDDAWAARILGARDAVTERQAPPSLTNRWTTSANGRNRRCAHTSGRIAGAGRMRQGV